MQSWLFRTLEFLNYIYFSKKIILFNISTKQYVLFAVKISFKLGNPLNLLW